MLKQLMIQVITVAALFSGGCGFNQAQADQKSSEKNRVAAGKDEVKLEQFANPDTKVGWGIAGRISDALLNNNLYQKKF